MECHYSATLTIKWIYHKPKTKIKDFHDYTTKVIFFSKVSHQQHRSDIFNEGIYKRSFSQGQNKYVIVNWLIFPKQLSYVRTTALSTTSTNIVI